MSRLTTRDFEPGDLERAAGLLAGRMARDRRRLPFMRPAVEEPGNWTRALERLAANPLADMVVALRGSTVVGYAGGQRMLFSPADAMAGILRPDTAVIAIDGHAAADGEDTTAVYRALYGALAGRWVEDGFFTHRWRVTAGDEATQEAVVSLGFGRLLTAATREVDLPVEGQAADITIRPAGVGDLAEVERLSDLLMRHHLPSPIFQPHLRTTEAGKKQELREMLAEDRPPVFLGFEGGRAIAMQSFLRPGFTPPLVDRNSDIYLYEGVVDPEAQSRGAGTATLRHAMEWAKEQELATCTLHFNSPNFSGGPFWLKHGFVPVEQTMERRIDERIAWANG